MANYLEKKNSGGKQNKKGFQEISFCENLT